MAALEFVPFVLLASCLATSCSRAPKTVLPQPVAASPGAVAGELPEEFAGGPAIGGRNPQEWWRAFADPVLDTVVKAVLSSNYDMAEAVARVHQARESARVARAEILPTVRARASVDDFSSPTNAGIGAQLKQLGFDALPGGAGGGFTLPERLGLTTYSLGADFAYELDFWKRAHNNELAAGAAYLASESDLQTARIGILAETISTYFEIVDLRRQLAIVHETMDVLNEREGVAEMRYDRGLSDSLALVRVRKDLLDTQARLPELENLLSGAEGRLAVLLGGYRQDLEKILPDSLTPSRVAEPVPVGIPTDLLAQRPDVRAAGHRLEAAGYAIKVRQAELRPSLSFSGTIGLQNSVVVGLFDVRQWFTNLATNLLVPVFDSNRLQSDVTLAEARFNEIAAAYGRTVVTAVQEVEAALADMRHQTQRHAILASRWEEARAEVELQSARYASGVGGYADFLDALRALLSVEPALASSDRKLALARLAIHRALGGVWTVPDTVEGPRTIPASERTGGKPSI